MARGPDLGGSGALAEQVSSLTPPSPPPPPAERVTPEDVQLSCGYVCHTVYNDRDSTRGTFPQAASGTT